MGPDYVRSMCHDIEDPTFDATAVATNPRAQVRPVHRPPRMPAGRTPALRVDRDHRRRHPPVSFSRRVPRAAVVPCRVAGAGPDRPLLAGSFRLLRSAGLRPRLRAVLALRAGADRRRGVSADAPALPGLPPRSPRPAARRRGPRDLREAADGDRRGGGRRASPTHSPCPCRRGCGAGARPAPTLQPGRLRLDRATPPPTSTAPGSRWSGPRSSDPSRRSFRPSTHTSTWRSPAPRGRSRSCAATTRPRRPARWRSPASAPGRPSPSSPGGRCRSRPSEWLLLVREDAAHPVWTRNSDGETPIIGVLRPRDRRGCDCPPGAQTPTPSGVRIGI